MSWRRSKHRSTTTCSPSLLQAHQSVGFISVAAAAAAAGDATSSSVITAAVQTHTPAKELANLKTTVIFIDISLYGSSLEISAPCPSFTASFQLHVRDKIPEFTFYHVSKKPSRVVITSFNFFRLIFIFCVWIHDVSSSYEHLTVVTLLTDYYCIWLITVCVATAAWPSELSSMLYIIRCYRLALRNTRHSHWNYTVSQKTSHLWLATILMYTIRLRQILAEVLLRK